MLVPRLRTPIGELARQDSEATLLLGEAIRGTHGDLLLTSFFRQLAEVDNGFFPVACLRHAICAYIASQVFPQTPQVVQKYKSMAHIALKMAIDTPQFGPLEAIAVFVMAWSAYVKFQIPSEDNVRDFDVHVDGLRRILSSESRYLPPTSQKAERERFRKFFALIRDKVMWMLAAEKSFNFADLDIFYSPFRRRLGYFCQLKKSAHPVEAWQAGWIEAVNDVQCDLVRFLLLCFHDFVEDEVRGVNIPAEKRQLILSYVESQLRDRYLIRGLSSIESELLSAAHGPIKTQFLQLQLAQRETIRVLFRILEASSICEGLGSAQQQAVTFSEKLKGQPRMSHETARNYYHDYSIIGIIIVAMIFARCNIRDRISCPPPFY